MSADGIAVDVVAEVARYGIGGVAVILLIGHTTLARRRFRPHDDPSSEDHRPAVHVAYQ
jgi:hypothetical protein